MPAATRSRRSATSGLQERQPWGTIVAFLLPALTIYVAFTAYPARAHALEQLPQGAAAPRGVRRPRQLCRARARRHLLAGRAQHHHLGVHLAAGRGLGRAAAGARALRQGAGRALLPRRLVHAGAHVLRRGRHPVAVDLQLRLGSGERGAACARARRAGRRPGSATRRPRCPRSSSSPAGCGSASTWWCCWPRCIRCPGR